MDLHELQKRLDIVESKLTISDLLHNGARANDRRDIGGMRQCYWPEAITSHGGYKGSSAGFIDFALPIIQSCLFAAHHISNVQVEVKGNRALAESHYFAHHRRKASEDGIEQDAFYEGRYVDILERREGVWKILYRRGLSDWSATMAANVKFADWPQGKHSQPAPDDDYYKILGAFNLGEIPK